MQESWENERHDTLCIKELWCASWPDWAMNRNLHHQMPGGGTPRDKTSTPRRITAMLLSPYWQICHFSLRPLFFKLIVCRPPRYRHLFIRKPKGSSNFKGACHLCLYHKKAFAQRPPKSNGQSPSVLREDLENAVATTMLAFIQGRRKPVRRCGR